MCAWCLQRVLAQWVSEAWALAGTTGNGILLSSAAYALIKDGGSFISAAFAAHESGNGAFIDIEAVDPA